MTLINVAKTDEAVHLYSDTRLTAQGTGWGLGNLPKVITVPHLNCVIATRGMLRSLDLVVRMVVPKANTLSELRYQFEEKFGWYCAGQVLAGDPVPAETQIFVVGWDNGPVAFLVTNENRQSGTPWRVTDIEGVVTPVVPDAIFTAYSQDDDKLAAILPIIQMQLVGSDVCGGPVVRTSVYADGIRQLVVA